MRGVRYRLAVVLLLAPLTGYAQPIPAYGARQPLYPARAVPAPHQYEPMVLPSGDVVEMEADAPAPVAATAGGEYLAGLREEAVWSGSVEAGLRYKSANNDSKYLNVAGHVSRDGEHWTNTLKGRLGHHEENGRRTKEEYRASFNSQYKLTLRSFLFGEAQYIYDRDSGYDYRINEVLGAGYHWVDNEDFRWTSSAGAGYQHAKSENGTRESSPLARVENVFFWQILERVGFDNLVRVDVSEFTSTYTESSLKTEVSDGLYVKFGVITEHLSDVPPGTDKLDVETLINLAYEY